MLASFLLTNNKTTAIREGMMVAMFMKLTAIISKHTGPAETTDKLA
jgi:hypothetical protein